MEEIMKSEIKYINKILIIENKKSLQDTNSTKYLKFESDLHLLNYLLKKQNIPQTKKMEFNIYEGFTSINELKSFIDNNKLLYDYVIIKFLGMYYGIFDGSYQERNSYRKSQMIIGKNIIWYWDDDHYCMDSTNISKLSNKIKERHKNYMNGHKIYNDKIATHLNDLDSNLDVIYNNRCIKNYKYAKSFLVLLGLTFIDTFFDKYEFNNYLNEYFKNNLDSFGRAFNDKSIIGINPFKAEVKFNCGTIGKYPFYFY